MYRNWCGGWVSACDVFSRHLSTLVLRLLRVSVPGECANSQILQGAVSRSTVCAVAPDYSFRNRIANQFRVGRTMTHIVVRNSQNVTLFTVGFNTKVYVLPGYFVFGYK